MFMSLFKNTLLYLSLTFLIGDPKLILELDLFAKQTRNKLFPWPSSNRS